MSGPDIYRPLAIAKEMECLSAMLSLAVDEAKRTQQGERYPNGRALRMLSLANRVANAMRESLDMPTEQPAPRNTVADGKRKKPK